MVRKRLKRILLLSTSIIVVIIMNAHFTSYSVIEQNEDAEIGRYVIYNPDFQKNFNSDAVVLEITDTEAILKCIEQYSVQRTLNVVDTDFAWIDVQFQFFIFDEQVFFILL